METYDHKEVTCDVMWDVVLDTRLPGEPTICCVCVGHNCKEAIEERARIPIPQSQESK